MTTYRFVEAWDHYPDSFIKFIDDIFSTRYDRVVFLSLNEWEWETQLCNVTGLSVLELNKKFADSNIIMDVLISGRMRHGYPELSHIKLHHTHDWFIIAGLSDLASHHRYASQIDMLDSSFSLLDNSDFKYPFAFLNHRSHPHRCMLMDAICQRDLLNKGAVTWHNLSTGDYAWKHFTPREMRLTDNFEPTWYLPPAEYHKSFCHLISESSLVSNIMSEKTFMPIYLMKPFLIQSAPGFYQEMDRLGFQRYTEIFDYSFDLVEDDQLRTQMIADNIANICSRALEELPNLHNQIKHKIEYNFRTAINIALDLNRIHPIFAEFLSYYKDRSNEIGIISRFEELARFKETYNDRLV